MPVDTPSHRFHNLKRVGNPVKERQRSMEQALEEAVSRALRDNLAPLQRTADELHQAYADLVAACSSSRPSNALPAMLRAQTAASALAAGLSVLSNFVAVALNPRDSRGSDDHVGATAVEEMEPEGAAPAPAHGRRKPAPPESKSDWDEEPEAAEPAEEPAEIPIHAAVIEEPPVAEPEPAAEVAAEAAAFDVASLPSELRDLHRRANRVAKVAMQDIKLLRPKDVRLGRENKDICNRLRNDIDKARKEYDRRFRAIQDHPVDYFHHWLLEILAEGDEQALGEYPYPSPVLRH
jgi:hypothetical protein